MLLLDTHVLLAVAAGNAGALQDFPVGPLYVSVTSLWEIAIKVRAGKLKVSTPVSDFEDQVEQLGCRLLPVTAAHVVAEVDPWPDTNDPFDRLLLAVCQVDGLRLVTRDRKLIGHPLAWRPRPA